MHTERFSKTDFSIMWKKLELIRILFTNGLCLLSPLYADYITARKDYIQRLANVSYLSSGPLGLIVIDYRVRERPITGLTISFVNLQLSMRVLPLE